MAVVEVFADVWCPFTHVGLRRLVERRAAAGGDFQLVIRAWPLELVNGEPLAADFVAEEIEALREQVAFDLFGGFDVASFPTTSLPALELAAVAYERDVATGERVSLALRDALFEQSRDIGDPAVLGEIAAGAGLSVEDRADAVRHDWDEGRARGVEGSPHFFIGDDGFFCPALDIQRVDGHLRIDADPAEFDRFVDRCLGA